LCEVFQEALASQNRFCDKNMTQKVSSRLWLMQKKNLYLISNFLSS
jgi:hypothetical protein